MLVRFADFVYWFVVIAFYWLRWVVVANCFLWFVYSVRYLLILVLLSGWGV